MTPPSLEVAREILADAAANQAVSLFGSGSAPADEPAHRMGTDAPAPRFERVPDPRLREIAAGEWSANRQEGEAVAAELLSARNALRYHEAHGRMLAGVYHPAPDTAEIGQPCHCGVYSIGHLRTAACSP